MIYKVFYFALIACMQLVDAMNGYSPDNQPIMQHTSDNQAFQRPYVDKDGKLAFPEGITDIRDGEFSGDTNIKEIIIPNSVMKIGGYGFANCSNVTSIYIDNGLKEIDNHAFDGITKVRDLVIPASVTKIGNDAFKGMDLRLLYICNQNCHIENNGGCAASYTNSVAINKKTNANKKR